MANTKILSEQIADNVALGGSPTTTTQSASDNSTKLATTAYVTTAVANLVDSAPSSLNTLNELAAALNDNASFFSTVLPLSGGTMTGNLIISTTGSSQISLLDSDNGFAASTVHVQNGGRDLNITAPQDVIFDFGSSGQVNFVDGGDIGINKAPQYVVVVLDSSGNAYISINRGSQSQGEVGLKVAGGTSGGDWYVYQKNGGDDLHFYNSSDLVTIKTDGKFGVGTTTPDTLVELVGADPILTIRDSSTSSTDGNATLRLAETGANDTLDQYFDIRANAGKLEIVDNWNEGGGTGTRVTLDDSGNLEVGGDFVTGGGGTSATGEIQFKADSVRARIVGGYDTGGGGYIAFHTDTTGGSDLERARFTNAGNLKFTNGNGIDFSATSSGAGATSVLFDDYEEGVHTTTLTAVSSGTITLNASYNKLYYTKIGRICHVNGYLVVSTVSNATGVLKISLPFAGKAVANNAASVFAFFNGLSSGTTGEIMGIIDQNSNTANFYFGSSQSVSGTVSQTLAGNSDIRFTATYHVD